MAVGVGLLFWSERFRSKGYAGFAYSLKAVGVGALYLSLWAASQYYHLVSPTVTLLRNGRGHANHCGPVAPSECRVAGRASRWSADF